MKYEIKNRADGTFAVEDETGRVVDEGVDTYKNAEALIAMYEEDGEGDERKRNMSALPDSMVWVNHLTPGSEALKRAEAATLAFDRKLAADAAAGAKVLEARGIAAPWTAIEKRVAAADLKSAQTEVRSAAPEADWQVGARKKLDSIDLTLEGHESPEAWLEAARKRCSEIDFEMRSYSSLPETHLMGVSSLNVVTTRPL